MILSEMTVWFFKRNRSVFNRLQGNVGTSWPLAARREGHKVGSTIKCAASLLGYSVMSRDSHW